MGRPKAAGRELGRQGLHRLLRQVSHSPTHAAFPADAKPPAGPFQPGLGGPGATHCVLRSNFPATTIPTLEMTESPNATGSWRRTLVPSAGLVLLALAAYANGFSGAFLYDDQSSIVGNPSLSRIWPPWAPLVSPAAGGTRGRPFANLTFAVNHWLGGLDVQGYHATNIGIHILAGLALFGIMRRTLARPPLAPRFASAAGPLAFAVSALWLVHPLTTESVTYLAQRTECLMGLCYLLTLYCVYAGRNPARPTGGTCLPSPPRCSGWPQRR